MRFVAEFVMQSRSRAAGVAVVAAAMPFLALLSCAVVALVWLRMGRQEGVKLLVWALLPALYYALAKSSPDVLFSLLVTAAMAEVLRSTQDWAKALGIGTLFAVLASLFLPWLPVELRAELIQLLMDQTSLAEQLSLSQAQQAEVIHLLGLLLNGAISAVQFLMVVAALALGRWWQSLLYNPGGFQQEFHGLRMPVWFAALLVLNLLLLILGMSNLLPVLPVLAATLIVAGLALVHGVFGIKGYNSFWLGMLYLLLLFALPYVSVLLILIAMADSLMNFRHRLAPPSSPPGDGEA